MARDPKDSIVRYDILQYFKGAQDALNKKLFALKATLQALADKYSRLDTVETGAEVNVINGVKVKDENITTVDGKVVTIDLGDYTKNEVTEVLKAKLDGIHEFASEVVVNPQREDGVTLAHISVNGEDKFIKRGAIEYGELEHIPATFPPSEHNHDERYYGKAETESKLDLKSDITHLHDDRYYTESEADNLLSQKSDIGHTHSQYLTAGSMLNTANLQGIISVDNLPNAALERLVNVADDTARFALTEASVQLGDTVKVASTGLMYIIKDISKLNSEVGYEVYTAGSASSVPWSGVTGKPSTYAPSLHTHDDRYYTESEIDSKLAGKQGSLTATGSATKGMYIDSSGTAKAMTYSVNKDVPSDAKFTDTVYTHPTTAGNKHIPSGGSSGQILRWSADGTAVWGADNNIAYSPATQSANGLMSAADKAKLDGIATGANAYTHPNSGVTAGTYRSVTVNTQGHVTGGSNPTTLSGYGITDAPTKTGGGASGTWGISISGKANTAGTADISKKVYGSYSYNGGQQGPAYFGRNSAGFLMSNANVNSDMSFKNWLYMDNYNGDDVGGATAFGVSRVKPRAFLMQSDAKRSSWNNYAELLSTYNYNTYAPKKDGTGASGTWGISISGNSATATKATQDSAGQQINTTYIKGLSVSGRNITYTKGNGTTGTITTQDTTYNFGGTTFYSGNQNTAEHNANNCLKNGHYYYDSNGPSTSIGATTNDGGLYTQSYDDSWGGQIAQDYRNGRLFVRGRTYGTWTSWLALLDSSNYNNYSPTKTGGGASGTWGISISGNVNGVSITKDSSGNIIIS